MFNLKNIIVPTDFSKLSITALEYAKEMAEKMDATIHLIYVLEKTPPFLALSGLNVSEEEVMKSMEEQAIKQLKKTSDDASYDATIRIIEILRKGVDYEEIIKYSKEINCDMIVLATHGRTGILHNLLGSVAEKVIRYAQCPVLVISPEEKGGLI